MKVRIAVGSVEGFAQTLYVSYGDLYLGTKDKLSWAGKEKREQIVSQFREFISFLKSHGIEVEGEDVLNGIV
jgi:hypothetical protein